MKDAISDMWAGLLAWVLDNSRPKLVVVMGGQANILINHLESIEKIIRPRTEYITHYAYIDQSAQGNLGPMHPQRIQAYSKEFARIRQVFDSLI